MASYNRPLLYNTINHHLHDFGLPLSLANLPPDQCVYLCMCLWHRTRAPQEPAGVCCFSGPPRERDLLQAKNRKKEKCGLHLDRVSHGQQPLQCRGSFCSCLLLAAAEQLDLLITCEEKRKKKKLPLLGKVEKYEKVHIPVPVPVPVRK